MKALSTISTKYVFGAVAKVEATDLPVQTGEAVAVAAPVIKE